MNEDYTKYTKAELIQRIRQLEARDQPHKYNVGDTVYCIAADFSVHSHKVEDIVYYADGVAYKLEANVHPTFEQLLYSTQEEAVQAAKVAAEKKKLSEDLEQFKEQLQVAYDGNSLMPLTEFKGKAFEELYEGFIATLRINRPTYSTEHGLYLQAKNALDRANDCLKRLREASLFKAVDVMAHFVGEVALAKCTMDFMDAKIKAWNGFVIRFGLDEPKLNFLQLEGLDELTDKAVAVLDD